MRPRRTFPLVSARSIAAVGALAAVGVLGALGACGVEPASSSSLVAPATAPVAGTAPDTSLPNTALPNVTLPNTTLPNVTLPNATLPRISTPGGGSDTSLAVVDPAVDAGWARSGEVLRITTQALYPVAPPFVPAGPDVVVYADGSVLVPFHGAFAVQPMVWPYERGRIDPAELAALYRAAAAGGLLDEAEPGLFPRIDVADAPRTTVLMVTGGARFLLQADALGTPADREPAEVAALREFVGRVHAAIEPVGELGEFYEPVALALAAVPDEASDGRGALAWPGGVRLAEVADCTIVTDPDTLAVLGQQYAGQRYADQGVVYQVAAGVAFPGDAAC